MGTDLHAFIELDCSQKESAFTDKEQIYAFNFGELPISRNYDLFNALADGRNCHLDRADIIEHCLYDPRGIPKYHSVAVSNRYFCIVLSTMTDWEHELGIGRTRLVFWFDS